MTNILLRCSNHFRNDIKLITINKNKKMINFQPLQHNKIFLRSVSCVFSNADMENKYTLKLNSEKEKIFKNMFKYINKKKYVKEKDILNIIEIIDSDQLFDSNVIHSLFTWCNKVSDCLPLERVKLGESLLLCLNVHNFKMSINHYKALLKLYIDNEHTFSTVRFLADMRSKQIYPDAYIYHMCIKYCCVKGNIDEALKLIQDMKMSQRSIPVTKHIFDLLMIGYSQSGDVLNVNKTLNIMKQNKLRLTGHTYAAVLYAYAILNDINKVKETIENCSSENIYFNNKVILNIIYIFTKNNHIKDIKTIYQYLMKNQNITYRELQIILKLIDINYSIAMEILTVIDLDHSHLKHIVPLILKHLINNKLAIGDIIKLFLFSKDESIFRKSLLVLLYYSLMKNDDLSLSLLKMCKSYYLIKPHYFWPLLVRQAHKYNLQGILDILQIMINDFNIKPCVDTIADYILPFIFGDVHHVRNVLIKYKINSTMINNAYALFMLKQNKLAFTAQYMGYFQDKYFYKTISVHLRCAFTATRDVRNFLNISYHLVEDVNSYESFMINELCNVQLVTVNRQLYDYINDFPHKEPWLRKVLDETLSFRF